MRGKAAGLTRARHQDGQQRERGDRAGECPLLPDAPEVVDRAARCHSHCAGAGSDGRGEEDGEGEEDDHLAQGVEALGPTGEIEDPGGGQHAAHVVDQPGRQDANEGWKPACTWGPKVPADAASSRIHHDRGGERSRAAVTIA